MKTGSSAQPIYDPNGGLNAGESLAGREIASYMPDINQGIEDVSPARRLFMPQQERSAVVAAVIAGASWIAAMSSLNVAAQLSLPDWIRARGMGLYTAVLYGCLALGSLLWGQVATRLGIALALLTAAAGAIMALLAAQRLPLQR